MDDDDGVDDDDNSISCVGIFGSLVLDFLPLSCRSPDISSDVSDPTVEVPCDDLSSLQLLINLSLLWCGVTLLRL